MVRDPRECTSVYPDRFSAADGYQKAGMASADNRNRDIRYH